MEADVSASSDAPKPGREKGKSKRTKLKSDELNKYLQQFDEKLNKLIEENKQLKKDLADEQRRGNQERAEKVEEQKRRQQLEKENHDLKEEISSYKEKSNVKDENEDGNQLLKDRLVAAEGELKIFKKLYLGEKMKLENEIKEATSDKLKAVEALKLVKNEKNKVEDDKKIIEKKSEEYMRCLEKTKYENKELTEKLKAEISKTEAGERKKLKELHLEEKMKFENEIITATSDKLKAVEALVLVKNEKNKLEDEKKAIEKKSTEYMRCLEKAKYEIKELTEKLKAEISKTEDNRKKFESGKLKIAEKVCAEIHKKLASEQKRQIDIERKKTSEQKARVEHITRVLEEEKQTREKLQKKIEDFESMPKRKCSTCSGKNTHHRDNSPSNENTILLRKMCTLLKKQAKHAEKKMNPEKIYIVQEPQSFQQSLMDLSNRVNLLDARLTQRIEGIDVLTESGSPQRTNEVKKKSNLLDSKMANHHSKKDSGAAKICCSGNTNFSGPISELVGTEPYKDMNKPQTSAICSNTSYSDKRLMGLKERDSIGVLPSTNIKLKRANKRSAAMNLSNDIPKISENKKKCILANDVNEHGSNKEHVSKRRKINDSNGDKISVFKKDVMNLESNVFPPTCSKNDDVTQQDKQNRQMNTEPHFIRTELDDLITFEKMIRGDCLKLLDMDSSIEEEKYRKAVETPLSPTLPCLEVPRDQLQVEGDNQCVVKKDDPLPGISKSSTDSVMIVQNKALAAINTTPIEFVDNAPINIRSPPENQIRSPGTRKIQAGDRNTASVGMTPQDDFHNHLNVSKQPTLCCVVHSDIKDKDSISRIICTRNTFASQNINASPLDHLVVQVHNVIAMDTTFVPREKGSVLLSLLICNISSRISVDFKSTLRKYLLPCCETSVAEINNVISNADTKALFEETCHLDVLTCLLEDFLIEKRTLVYWDKLYDNGDTSSIVYQFDGKYILSKPATIDQFIAGCIILASISSAANRVGFLLQTSYKILRTFKTEDVSWILSALHIFASVNGNNYFAVDEHKFLTVALNSVVQLIETTRAPFTGPCNSSHYKECSFATGALCMEKLTALLLDALQCFISGVKDQNVHSSNYFSVSMVHDGENTISSGSSLLFTFIKHEDDIIDGFLQRAYCHINDVISLLELIGCYMSWEWTWNTVVPSVLKTLESCPNEEFSIALLNLIGQLGRFGIEANDHKSKGLPEIRSNISMFLDTSKAKTTNIRVQFAAAVALLNLLPYTLKEIVDKNENFNIETELSDNARAIKSWFSGLSEQNKSICFKIFDDVYVCKRM